MTGNKQLTRISPKVYHLVHSIIESKAKRLEKENKEYKALQEEKTRHD